MFWVTIPEGQWHLALWSEFVIHFQVHQEQCYSVCTKPSSPQSAMFKTKIKNI